MRLLAYLDDIVFVAGPAIAEAVLAFIEAELKQGCGLTLEDTNTQAWTRSGSMTASTPYSGTSTP